jgi:hypothetical protein
VLKYNPGSWGANNEGSVKGFFATPVKRGSVYTLHIAGTADHDIPFLNVTFVNSTQDVNWWKTLSDVVQLGKDIKAATPFDFTINITASADGGSVKEPAANMIVFDGLAKEKADTGANDSEAYKGNITISITAFEIK